MTDHDVFIAHASPDKALARELHEALTALGLRPFLDAIDLLPGDEWDLELPRALARSRVVAILVGATHDTAYYLREEIALSIAYARADATAHRAVPVYLHGRPEGDQAQPYGLRIRNGLDWPTLGGAAGVAQELARLFGAVKTAPVLGEEPPPSAPVEWDELSREQRYDVFIKLLPAQREEILMRIGAPLAELPPATVAPATRALSVIQWLDLQAVATRRRFDALLRSKAPGLFE